MNDGDYGDNDEMELQMSPFSLSLSPMCLCVFLYPTVQVCGPGIESLTVLLYPKEIEKAKMLSNMTVVSSQPPLVASIDVKSINETHRFW
jgi:hypothetical protein